MERMKYGWSKILLLYAILNIVTFIVATENQTFATFNESIQKSSSALYQDDLFNVLQSLQFPSTSTEKRNVIQETQSLPKKDSVRIEDDVTNKVLNFADYLKNLSKRQATNSMLDKVSETQPDYTQSNSLLVDKLENCSCEMEALDFGHHHVCEIIVHEFFCELSKLLRYILIAVQNLKSQFPLFSLFNVTKDVISFTNFTFSETSPESIKTGAMSFGEFLDKPKNIQILIDIIQKSVPTSSILKSVTKLTISMKKFLTHIQKLFTYLGFRFNFVETLITFEEGILAIKEKLLSMFYGYLLNPVEETTNLFFEATVWVESISGNFVTYTRQKLYQYLTVLEEIIDTLQAFHNGYYASGFSQSLIAVMFLKNETSEQLSPTKTSLTNVTSPSLQSSIPGSMSNFPYETEPSSKKNESSSFFETILEPLRPLE